MLLTLVAFIGSPIAAKLLGHGPNDITQNGVDANTFLPVGPMTSFTDLTAAGPKHYFFILGADSQLGRDEFLRMLYGAQTSLEVAVGAMLLTMIIGVTMGAIAGFYGGVIDTVVSRITEIVMAFPVLLFVIALASTAGERLDGDHVRLPRPGVFTLVVVLGLFGWFYPARIVRAQVLSLREKEFVEAARMIGTSDWKIIRSHVLPAPGRADHRLRDAGHRPEHPRRGRSLVPRRRDQAADLELGEPALDRADLLPDPAVADGLAGADGAARDARVQPARRRPARRVRSSLDRLSPADALGACVSWHFGVLGLFSAR